MVVADISSLWTPSIYAPKSQVYNNGLTVAEVTKKNSNRDTLRYDLCCCQDNHFCLLQDNEVCPVIVWIIQTPDRQYGVLTHIDDFKGFLTS